MTRIVLWLALALSASSGFAQSNQSAPGAPASTDPSIQGYGDHDKTCRIWTDACRTCERTAEGAVHCSNVGIACQPVAISCSSREAEKSPQPSPPTSPPSPPPK